MAKALGPAWSVAGLAFIRWCARPSVLHTPPQSHSPCHEDAILDQEDRNDAEVSSSLSAHRSRRPSSPPLAALLRDLPPVPRLEDYVMRPARVITPAKRPRNRRYVSLEKYKQRWRVNVSLPAGVHGAQTHHRDTPPHSKPPRAAALRPQVPKPCMTSLGGSTPPASGRPVSRASTSRVRRGGPLAAGLGGIQDRRRRDLPQPPGGHYAHENGGGALGLASTSHLCC
jgi:hypothetical protein